MSRATDAIKARIIATLEGVADIGVVQEYQRYGDKLSDFKTFYLSATHSQIRGWYVKRISVRESESLGDARPIEICQWRIMGYVAIDDAAATEVTIDNLVDDIRDAFDANPDLDNTVSQITVPQSDIHGIQMDALNEVMFAGVLCHQAQLSLFTVRYL